MVSEDILPCRMLTKPRNNLDGLSIKRFPYAVIRFYRH